MGGGEDYVGEWRGLKRAAVSAVQCSAVHGSSTWYRTVLVPGTYCTGKEEKTM